MERNTSTICLWKNIKYKIYSILKTCTVLQIIALIYCYQTISIINLLTWIWGPTLANAQKLPPQQHLHSPGIEPSFTHSLNNEISEASTEKVPKYVATSSRKWKPCASWSIYLQHLPACACSEWWCLLPEPAQLCKKSVKALSFQCHLKQKNCVEMVWWDPINQNLQVPRNIPELRKALGMARTPVPTLPLIKCTRATWSLKKKQL